MLTKGTLIISLDFELYWGMHDVLRLEQYKENLLGVRQVLPRMLELFNRYGIHATWGTVGLLFFETKEEMEKNIPSKKPTYRNLEFSPYEKMDMVGSNETEDPFHFASSLIDQIAATPFQEIGTHTFSHYYCLEEGQNAEQFEADIKAAVEIAKTKNVEIKTILFPRNQANEDYLRICRQYGITAYRGNEQSFLYEPASYSESTSSLKRLIRLADAYINLTGHHIYSLRSHDSSPLVNLPSSRFLRPFDPKLKFLEPLRIRRIKNSMSRAAEENKVYHLWWHPHNFGKNSDENMANLTEILEHYLLLNRKYGMKSLNMEEARKAAIQNTACALCQ